MSAITYTAKDRGDLIAGHSEETEYSFDLYLQEYQVSNRVKGNTTTSLSGVMYSNFHHIERTASVVTSPTASSTVLNNIREFLTSVVAGEQFTLDVYGTTLVSDNPLNFKLMGDYSESLNPQTNETSFEFVIVRS